MTPKVPLRKCLVGTAIALVAFAPVACSSDDNNDSVASSATSVAAAGGATATGPAPAAPSAQVLHDNLALLVDPAKPASQKAAAVVNGQARLANYEKLTAALANYPVTFDVKDVKMSGRNADATVDVGSPHGSMPIPMTWEYVDGQWKLADGSSCQLLSMGQAPCQ